MTTPSATVPWRAIILTAYVPAVLNATGRGAIMPMIPVVAVASGASLGEAGFIAALLLVGALIGDLPSGVIVARFGERRSMIGASVVTIIGSLVAGLLPHALALAAGTLIIGIASAVFALARQAYITSYVPYAVRARALSTLGGSYRLGIAIGPFLIAALLAAGAGAVAAFWVLVAGSLASIFVLLLVPTEHEPTRAAGAGAHASHAGLGATLRANWRLLATVGAGSAAMAGLRATRQVILPLWAVAIGLDETLAAVIIGASMLLDFALFYLSGWTMDRVGRRIVAIPCLAALALGHLLLAVSIDLAGREWWFVAAALWLAVANGLCSGVLMTLGADLADPANPAPFLGAWRFTNDLGGMVAPLILSGVTALASLPIAALVIAVLGAAGVVVWQRTLIESRAPDLGRTANAKAD